MDHFILYLEPITAIKIRSYGVKYCKTAFMLIHVYVNTSFKLM